MSPPPELAAAAGSAEASYDFGVAPFSGVRADLELLRELVRRDLKTRYRGSLLGVLWSLLNPLMYLLVYSLVFTHFVRVAVPGVPYTVFLLSGLLAWTFVSNSITVGGGSVIANAPVVVRSSFSRILLPISAVLVSAINYLISLLLLVPFLLYFHVRPGLSLLTLPLIIVVMVLLAMGPALLLASGSVYFRDLEHMTVIGLQVGFFLTPIVYTLDSVRGSGAGGALRLVVLVNPVTWVVGALQDVLAYGRWPTSWTGLAYAAGVAGLLLAAGWLVFSRLSGRFAEEL